MLGGEVVRTTSVLANFPSELEQAGFASLKAYEFSCTETLSGSCWDSHHAEVRKFSDSISCFARVLGFKDLGLEVLWSKFTIA